MRSRWPKDVYKRQAQQKRFAEYFLNRGTVSFTLHDKQYEVLIDEVSCYPQSYAAAITVFLSLIHI